MCLAAALLVSGAQHDNQREPGAQDVLVCKIQERYGHAKEQAGKYVDAFYDELTPMAI